MADTNGRERERERRESREREERERRERGEREERERIERGERERSIFFYYNDISFTFKLLKSKYFSTNFIFKHVFQSQWPRALRRRPSASRLLRL